MGWSLIDNLFGSGVTFLVGLILARLLSPSEFGIIGIITAFIAIFQLFVDSGFSQALIRKIEVEKKDYDTLFICSTTISIILFLIVVITAPIISAYFKQPILTPTLRLVAFVLPANALTLPHKVILTRKLDFRTQAIVTIIASISSGFLGILMAFNGLGVWSLAWQILTRNVIQTLVLSILCRWYPKIRLSWESLHEMFSFGYKLLLSGLIDTLYKNIFLVLIGKIYSPSALGQYTRASLFSQIFSSNLTSVIQKVSYPSLSSLQEDEVLLKNGYRKMIKVSMLISFALMLAMAAIAKPLIMLLIGEKWLPAAYYLQILCLAEMLYPLHSMNLNILNVKGRSDLFLKLEVIKKGVAIPMFMVGMYYSITAMLWCGVAVSFIAYFVNSYYSGRLINYPLKDQLRDIIPAFSVSFFVAGIMWLLSLLSINYLLMISLQITLGFFLAIGIFEGLKLDEYIEIKTLSLRIMRTIWSKSR